MRRGDKPQEEYADIIDLPHHVSDRHPQMSLMKRAAQFAPFSALTGYETVIAEAGRLTEQEALLEEDSLQELDRKLALLRGLLEEQAGQVETGLFFEEKEEEAFSGKKEEEVFSGRTKAPSLPRARITYFQPDERKAGGKYVTVEGSVRRIDDTERSIRLQTGTEDGKKEESRIAVSRIAGIEILP